MATQRHLRSAPVKEALIDFQFEQPVAIELIEEFASSIADRYPDKSDIWQSMVGIDLGSVETKSHSSIDQLGKRLSSGQHPFIAQVRKNGFTLSRLQPYVDWGDLRAEAKLLWDKFVEQGNVEVVQRVAVRYINEIKIPLPINDFGEFLTCPPEVPKALPQAINGFMTRVVIPSSDDPNEVAIVTQASETLVADQASIVVVLDIDVFRTWSIPATGDLIWSCLDRLRDKKNNMFFEHLQEKTVEMYE